MALPETTLDQDLADIVRTRFDRLIVAGSHSTLAMSDDGGLHWHQGRLEDGEQSATFKRVRELESGALFATTGYALYRSDDSGATWRPLPVSWKLDEPTPLRDGASEMALTADRTQLLFTACRYNTKSDDASSTIHRTRDGVQWEVLEFEDQGVFGAIAELPDGTRILANRGSIFRSAEGRWLRADSPQNQVMELVLAGTRAWGATTQGVIVSSDGGASWSAALEAEALISRLAVDGERLCAVGRERAFLSRDGGKTWATRAVGKPLAAAVIVGAVAIVVGAGGTLERLPFE